MKKLKCILAFLMLMLGQVGFASSSELTVAWPMGLGPLNPHLYSPNQMFAQAMVYEPLVKYETNGEIVPWLAESWSASDDGRVYDFKLREGVQFSNGEPFNAETVVENFRVILENRESHSWLELANQIEGVEAVDEHTVRLSLGEPYYPLLHELALPRPFRFLAPSQFVAGQTIKGIQAPVGTGPWQYVDSRPGEYYRFKRNEKYWGAAPAYDAIKFKIMPDPNARAIALETGEVDLVYGIAGILSPDMVERFKKKGVMNVHESEPYTTMLIAINSNSGPTTDLAVRQAIKHAVNKDLMIETVLYGTQKRADTLFVPNTPYTDVSLDTYEYDPEKARLLLEEAGWELAPNSRIRQRDGKPLQIDLAFVGTDALYKSMAEVVQADLAKIGISVTLIGEEEGSIQARERDGRFGMVFHSTWGAPYDPHAFLSSMRVPSHADYQAQQGLADKKEIDDLIGAVLLSSDEGERQGMYHDILTRLHNQAVYLPLTYIPAIAVSNSKVQELSFGAIASDIPFELFRPSEN